MESDKPQFHVGQFEVLYTGALQAPVVRLVSLDSGVLDSLLQRLAPFGATLEYAGYNPSWQNLSQAYLELKFLDGYGVCRLWPKTLELRFQRTPLASSSVLRDQASQLLAGAVSALESADRDIHLTSHSFTISLHGQLDGEPVADFLRRFIKEPPAAFGVVSDLGAKYTFEPDAEGRSAWLHLEPSASIQPDGLYVILGVTFDADEIDASQAVSHAAGYLEATLSRSDFPVKVI